MRKLRSGICLWLGGLYLRLGLCAAMLLLPGAAQAKWLEVQSSHFIVYVDDNEVNARNFSQLLERFHAAMMGVLQVSNPLPSPSNRVTVFVVNNDSQVRKLSGDGARNTYAFYLPRAGGSIVITPHVDANLGALDFSMIALLHEYVHHVTFSVSDVALPGWMVEGAAEFFASAKFERNGDVDLGLPAQHRANDLNFAEDVTVAQLVDPNHYKYGSKPGEADAFYGKSWLLYHYLMFNKPRAGQLTTYVRLINSGKSSPEAAKLAFGDLDRLEGELATYRRQSMMTGIRMPAGGLTMGPITLRELGAGEAAMMPLRIRSKRGVDRKQALALLPEAQKIAAAWPKDAAVLSELAEAEHDAGNYEASVAAADRALAIDPKLANAYVQKGYSLFDLARKASDKKTAYDAARAPFLALNALENDHPLPLAYYYLSFVEQGRPPGENGVAALRRAVELAPFDAGLRWTLALQALRDKNVDEAAANLKPIAYNPHGGAMADRTRTMLAQLESGASPEDVLRGATLPLPTAAGAAGGN